jgi:hypothetical protein
MGSGLEGVVDEKSLRRLASAGLWRGAAGRMGASNASTGLLALGSQRVRFRRRAHDRRFAACRRAAARNTASDTGFAWDDVMTYDAIISAPNPNLLLKPEMIATVQIVVDRPGDDL